MFLGSGCGPIWLCFVTYSAADGSQSVQPFTVSVLERRVTKRPETLGRLASQLIVGGGVGAFEAGK